MRGFVNTLWVVLALGGAGAAVAVVTSWLRGSQAEDMGAVSNQWIAEHRLGSNQDSRR
jgi:hypothetical protein